MSHVFVSYVREDHEMVDRLVASLRAHGLEVWIDREQIEPGERWQTAIRNAIREGAYFLACFSSASEARARSYMNEELTLAIDELRKRPAERRWFIPVLLSDCAVPERPIGAGETLGDIQWVSLAHDWEEGLDLILKTIDHPRQRRLSYVELKFIRVDEKPVSMKEYGDLKISIDDKKIGVLSGFSVLKTEITAQRVIDIKAECFLEDRDSHPRKGSWWVGTLIHEAVLRNVQITTPLAILVGYTRGADNWFDKLLGGYYVLSMRADSDSVGRSEFNRRSIRGERLDAFS